jgi:hypothetical protein
MSMSSESSSKGQRQLAQSKKRDLAYQEEIQELRLKYETTVQKYELALQETFDHIQKLELDLSDRSSELQVVIGAKRQSVAEIAVRDRQIDELGSQLVAKDNEIARLKNLMRSSLATSTGKLDLERQRNEIENLSFQRTIALQQSELTAVRKRCQELECEVERLKCKLQLAKESSYGMRSASKLTTEVRPKHLISNKKLDRKEDNCLGNWSTREAIVSNIDLAADEFSLAPIDLDERVFQNTPQVNFSDICKTPSKSFSPEPSNRSGDGKIYTKMLNKLSISPPRLIDRIIVENSSKCRKVNHMTSINRYVTEMDPLDREIEEIFRLHPCKNANCLCGQTTRISVPKIMGTNSVYDFLWEMMRTVFMNVITKLVVWDRLGDFVDKRR